MLRFGTTDAPRLTKDNLNHEAVNKFITHIRNLIRANAFDDSVMQQLIPTSVVGLAGTTMNSSIYGSVVFDLTLFNEVTRTDCILWGIRASVIDSCIEVIVGLPDIRSLRLIHIIPSYFDTPDPTYLEPQTTSQGQNPPVSRDSATLSLLAPSRKPTQNNTARCRGAAACNKCSPFIAMGYPTPCAH